MTFNLKESILSAGGYSKVAVELGTTKQVVWSWVNVLKEVPPVWVSALSDLLEVPRSEIRPDIFPMYRENLNYQYPTKELSSL